MTKKMYGDWIVLCITLLYSQITWCLNNLDSSHNIICQPLPKVVAVNGNGLPYFVELHQCQGQVKNSDPRTKKCTFNEFENVKVKITHFGHTSGEEYVTLKNHTSCKEECSGTCPNFLVHDKRCVCSMCPHDVAPVGHECPDDFTWDSKTCKCKCNLKEDKSRRRKKLNETQCKYVCRRTKRCDGGRTFSPDTCTCIRTSAVSAGQDTDSSQQGTLIAALVIGEFVLLCLIFDAYLYSNNKGLMYNIRCKVFGKPERHINDGDANNRKGNNRNGNNRNGNNRDEEFPLRENSNRNEENNVPIDVRVDQNGSCHLAAKSSDHHPST